MSDQPKRPYSEMIFIAERIKSALEPFCDKIIIAGSLRRKASMVSDIEICLLPKPYEVGLFASGIAPIIDSLKFSKGELHAKMAQRFTEEGVQVDFFIASPDNYGNICLIRTGRWDFSKYVLGTLVRKAGYIHEEGYLLSDGKIVPCPTEESFFNRINLPYIEPEKRTLEYVMAVIG